jgi:translation initiation factor 2 alpha subunit (eIF-2alpha)
MEEELMSIENTPQLRSFLQMWMMSGGMVVSTIEGVVNDGRGIQLPEIQGRNFKEELVNLSELISKIVSRIE